MLTSLFKLCSTVINTDVQNLPGAALHVLFDVLEKLGSVKVEVPEVTQSEMGQKQKLREVLDMVNHLLNLTPSWVDQKWSVDSM